MVVAAVVHILWFNRKAGREYRIEYGSLIVEGAVILHLYVQLGHPHLHSHCFEGSSAAIVVRHP